MTAFSKIFTTCVDLYCQRIFLWRGNLFVCLNNEGSNETIVIIITSVVKLCLPALFMTDRHPSPTPHPHHSLILQHRHKIYMAHNWSLLGWALIIILIILMMFVILIMKIVSSRVMRSFCTKWKILQLRPHNSKSQFLATSLHCTEKESIARRTTSLSRGRCIYSCVMCVFNMKYVYLCLICTFLC